MYTSDITEESFNKLDTNILFVKTQTRKYSKIDIFNAILYQLDNGGKWRSLPINFPPYRSVFYYFSKWKNNGVLDIILAQTNVKARHHLGLPCKPTIGIIDSSSIDNFNVSEINGYDGNKKKDGIKRFIITDDLGLVLSVKCTSANKAEVHGAKLFANQEFKKTNYHLTSIIADKGFVSKQLKVDFSKFSIDFRAMQRTGNIRNKSNHCIAIDIHASRVSIANMINKAISVTRWVVERTFAWMTNKRRLAKNYEKTTASAEAMVKLFGIALALKKLI